DVEPVRQAALDARINLRYADGTSVDVALNETAGEDDVADVVRVFASTLRRPESEVSKALERDAAEVLPASLRRSSPFLTHPVFNTHRSETQMMRYIRSLEHKD